MYFVQSTTFAITFRPHLAHGSTLLLIISSFRTTYHHFGLREIFIVGYYKKIKIVCCDRRQATDTSLVVRRMQEEYRDKEKKQFISFANFDEAFDRITTKVMGCGRLEK